MAVDFAAFAAVLRDLDVPGEVRELPSPAPTATTAVAALLGVAVVGRADAKTVRARTGQAIGGVGPVGHPAPAGRQRRSGRDSVWLCVRSSSLTSRTTSARADRSP